MGCDEVLAATTCDEGVLDGGCEALPSFAAFPRCSEASQCAHCLPIRGVALEVQLAGAPRDHELPALLLLEQRLAEGHHWQYHQWQRGQHDAGMAPGIRCVETPLGSRLSGGLPGEGWQDEQRREAIRLGQEPELAAHQDL